MNFFWKYLINYHTSVVYLYNKYVKHHSYRTCGRCVVVNAGSHDFSYLPSHPNFQYLIFQWVASTASNSLQQLPIITTIFDSCSTLQFSKKKCNPRFSWIWKKNLIFLGNTWPPSYCYCWRLYIWALFLTGSIILLQLVKIEILDPSGGVLSS